MLYATRNICYIILDSISIHSQYLMSIVIVHCVFCVYVNLGDIIIKVMFLFICLFQIINAKSEENCHKHMTLLMSMCCAQ